MTKRIIAIVFIFICTSVAWAILGGTIFSRTYDSGALSSKYKSPRPGAHEQNQAPPSASSQRRSKRKKRRSRTERR